MATQAQWTAYIEKYMPWMDLSRVPEDPAWDVMCGYDDWADRNYNWDADELDFIRNNSLAGGIVLLRNINEGNPRAPFLLQEGDVNWARAAIQDVIDFWQQELVYVDDDRWYSDCTFGGIDRGELKTFLRRAIVNLNAAHSELNQFNPTIVPGTAAPTAPVAPGTDPGKPAHEVYEGEKNWLDVLAEKMNMEKETVVIVLIGAVIVTAMILMSPRKK